MKIIIRDSSAIVDCSPGTFNPSTFFAYIYFLPDIKKIQDMNTVYFYCINNKLWTDDHKLLMSLLLSFCPFQYENYLTTLWFWQIYYSNFWVNLFTLTKYQLAIVYYLMSAWWAI